jgi:hypothetical protein
MATMGEVYEMSVCTAREQMMCIGNILSSYVLRVMRVCLEWSMRRGSLKNE